MLINQNGGKVINSGGFGCIFDPSLKCENTENSNESSHNKISKLMITKYAQYEYDQIEKYNDLLNVIPNYNNYFLLNNFQLCKPDKLTTNDLKGYKKCKNIKKAINGKNINKSLNELMIINMPNGGINIEQFIKEYFSIKSNIIRLNNSLIDLLINGIIPMNKLNVYHCDIKEGNVLVQHNKTIFVTRLIDWGVSFIWNNNYKGIPAKLYRRPFQFNVPFSSILFNKDFIKLYNNFLELNPNPTFFNIREFVINYIFIWNNIRGSGHLNIINNIIKKFTINELTSINYDDIKEQLIEYDFTHYYIVEYLSKILDKYTNNKKLDLILYFKNVFLKNIDIWGFTMIYIEFYNNLYNTFNTLNEYQMEFIIKIKYIIIHFLYESHIIPIDISSLTNELTNLNKLIEKFDVTHSSKKIEYISKLKNNVDGFIKNKITKKKRGKYGEKTRKQMKKKRRNK